MLPASLMIYFVCVYVCVCIICLHVSLKNNLYKLQEMVDLFGLHQEILISLLFVFEVNAGKTPVLVKES